MANKVISINGKPALNNGKMLQYPDVSGGGVLKVSIQYDGDDLRADKTFAEIQAALQDNKYVFAEYVGTIYSLAGYSDYEISFYITQVSGFESESVTAMSYFSIYDDESISEWYDVGVLGETRVSFTQDEDNVWHADTKFAVMREYNLAKGTIVGVLGTTLLRLVSITESEARFRAISWNDNDGAINEIYVRFASDESVEVIESDVALQKKLIAGTGISIAPDGKTISATGHGPEPGNDPVRLEIARTESGEYYLVTSLMDKTPEQIYTEHTLSTKYIITDRQNILVEASYSVKENTVSGAKILVISASSCNAPGIINSFTIRIFDKYNATVSVMQELIQGRLIPGDNISISADNVISASVGETATYNLRLMSQSECASLYETLHSASAQKYGEYKNVVWNAADHGKSRCIKMQDGQEGYGEYLTLYFYSATVRLYANGTIEEYGSGVQEALIAGSGISIASDGKTISATGGGGTRRIINDMTQAERATLYQELNSDPLNISELYIRYDDELGSGRLSRFVSTVVLYGERQLYFLGAIQFRAMVLNQDGTYTIK